MMLLRQFLLNGLDILKIAWDIENKAIWHFGMMVYKLFKIYTWPSEWLPILDMKSEKESSEKLMTCYFWLYYCILV